MPTPSHITDAHYTLTQGRNFQVVHLRNPKLITTISSPFNLLGTYPTLATAQRIASRAFAHALLEYQNRGYDGRYSNDINLHCRGMITAYIQNTDTDVCLSKFHINEIYIGSDVEEPGEGFCTGYNNVANAQQEDKGDLAQWVRRALLAPLSVVQPLRFSEEDVRRMCVADWCWVNESAPFWSRSRVPLFDRRGDAPFRGCDDALYETVFAVGRARGSLRRSEDGADEGREGGVLDVANEED
ncbi:hypothetical protein NX059_008493 [Plenodomus lindquistii]|nr:hypothetical protein NX059_008493 [Plenodomus lindquistii]